MFEPESSLPFTVTARDPPLTVIQYCTLSKTVLFYRAHETLLAAVELKLMYAYCLCYYGCELWELSNNLCVTWRKGLRRVWGLPYNTHGRSLNLVHGGLAGAHGERV